MKALATSAAVLALAAGGITAARSAGSPVAGASAVRLVEIGSFDSPTFVTSPPGDASTLYVTEQDGVIRTVNRAEQRTNAQPFLDIRSRVSSGGERGLLSMAFPPDHARTGLFYVYFTDRGGDIRIQEFRRRDATSADPASARSVLRQEHSRFPNHNGGQLQYGPDGLLYASLGDGGGGGDVLGSGQRLSTKLGKLLRIDPRRAGGRPYTIPAGNPFRRRRGARGEIYSYGLRNPYRFSFDRQTGDLTIGDVGQDEVEEINFARRGRGRGDNYGWNRFEGRRRFSSGPAPGHVPPVLQRFHGGDGVCSITGGYVVRDPELASLRGRYVYGDFCKPQLRSAILRPGRARDDGPIGANVEGLSSFGEDADGRVYAVSLHGKVFRIAPG